MTDSFNSTHKLFIRENWNKPLIKFLTDFIKDKLVYLGLPSPMAEDVLEWIRYIKTVIAFQCRDYGNKSRKDQSRSSIIKLNELLSQLEREGKIENYFVFDGWLEEVVLRGYDNSPSRIIFDLSYFVTLYNLDFCNNITSPIKFTDKNGNPCIAFKFDAINKLLQIQRSISHISNKFVLFFTVHCDFNELGIKNFIDYPPNEETKGYIQKYLRLKGLEKNARMVRLFFAYYIKQQFEAFGFSPLILPTILYHGLGGASLLHFSVLGINPIASSAGVVPSYQSLTEILNQKFISINNSEFINKSKPFDNENDVNLNPIDLFIKSNTFNKLWK